MTTKQIRFQKHYVTDGATKARVSYHRGILVDGRDAVTLYAKDYSDNLGAIFGDAYENATDYQTDYFDEGHVRILPDSPLWAAAVARCEQNKADWEARYAAKMARRAA